MKLSGLSNFEPKTIFYIWILPFKPWQKFLLCPKMFFLVQNSFKSIDGQAKNLQCMYGSLKDLYQVQETWKFFFLTYIQLCVPTPIFRMSKVLSDGSTWYKDINFNFLFIILHKKYLKCKNEFPYWLRKYVLWFKSMRFF